MTNTLTDMDKIVSLAKRRGFVFPSSEIYGGINGFWDFGPIGVELRRKVKEAWWRHVVQLRDDVVGVDTSIIAHPQMWVASGHVANFSDPMIDCKKCKARFRADDMEGARCPEKPSKRPGECEGELTEPRQFNLMFKTFVGPVEDGSAAAYLRPETCQSIFAQFKNVQITSRLKPPFGIAQIGKSFRNEITPRNFIFRSREFEQMEMEYFVPEERSEAAYHEWVEARRSWFVKIGVREENLRLREHAKTELAHYAKGCTDVEYRFPFGWGELEGIANRSAYDLTQHSTVSGKDLSYFDDEKKLKYLPWVIESSVGVDRTFLTLLCDAYHEEAAPTAEEGEKENRVVLRFKPSMAPVTAAFFPLSKKLTEPVKKIEQEIRRLGNTDFDAVGSIGKRYRRHDEIGTPFCVTYDFDSETDQKVTIRERDSMRQERIAISQLRRYIEDRLEEA